MEFVTPDWIAPANVVAVSTSSAGGSELLQYGNFNLAMHVGDTSSAVETNRQQLKSSLQGLDDIQWLTQVHGTRVLKIHHYLSDPPDADASITTMSGLACVVLTADCLPVLLCDQDGYQVAAAHAGWRGLVNGVLENAVNQFQCQPDQIMAWLGPAISQRHFEVGSEVRNAFLLGVSDHETKMVEEAFLPSQRHGHYYADLYQLARIRLRNAGVSMIYGGHFCTFEDDSRFYSYRRNQVTGRSATLIYKHT